MRKAIDLFLLIIVILSTVLLVFIRQNKLLFELNFLKSENLRYEASYQIITLCLCVSLLILFRLTKKDAFQTYFKKGNIKAEVKPEPWLGLKPKSNENWLTIGRNFAIIISIVTAIVIYFQATNSDGLTSSRILAFFPFSILFALINSFVEESITRLGVIIPLSGRINPKLIAIFSALLFGIVHYWGHPGGFAGVLFASFLGWFLAKSIIETKGIFWAWVIHFFQDVIIFSALLSL